MISKPFLTVDPGLSSIRYKGGASMTLHDIRNAVEKACEEHGLNVIVTEDVITSGRLFDKSTTECLVVKNAEHQNDYFHEVITMKSQGIYAFFEFYYTGNSKNNSRVNAGNKEHSTITGSIIGAIKKATVSNAAMEEETLYYTMLCDAISSVFN